MQIIFQTVLSCTTRLDQSIWLEIIQPPSLENNIRNRWSVVTIRNTVVETCLQNSDAFDIPRVALPRCKKQVINSFLGMLPKIKSGIGLDMAIFPGVPRPRKQSRSIDKW